jgi:hypothetical protein
MAKVMAEINLKCSMSRRNGVKHHIITAVDGMLMDAPTAGDV